MKSYRHVAISISRQFLNGDFKDAASRAYGEDDPGPGSEDDDEEGGESAVWARQAAHSLRTDMVVYGRETQQLFSSTSLEQEQFRRISVQWHRFLGFPSARTGLSAASLLPYEAARERARRSRLETLRSTPLVVPLRAMLLSPDAAFRGQQATVLEAVIRGQTPVLQIAGTGEGKSLSFFLPAYAAPEGVTVVVAPLVSLQGDLVRRADAYRIESAIYTYGAPTPARLVFVSPESVATDAFLDFVRQLAEAHQLDRVVIDEAHLVLDATPSFRPSLLTLGRTVARLGVQFLLLTATLPPRDMAVFAERVGIDLARTAVFRGSTVRPQLEYIVRRVRTAEEEMDQAVAYVGALMASLSDPQAPLVIIFATSVARTVEIANRLACPAYHAKVGTPPEKAAILQGWINTGGPIAATNALGLGLDVPNVRFVIHAGAPRDLRDYAQESGRCGRDGVRGACVLFSTQNKAAYDAPPGPRPGPALWTMQDYLQDTYGCRRVVLDAVLDSDIDRTGCAGNEVPCDLCQKERRTGSPAVERPPAPAVATWATTAVGTAALDAERQRLAVYHQALFARQTAVTAVREVADAVRLLQQVTKACAVCLAYGAEPQYHGVKGCPRPRNDRVRNELRTASRRVVQWLRQLRLAPYAGCDVCLLPQAWCPSWEAAHGDGGSFRRAHPGRCHYRTVLVTIFTLVQALAPLRTAFVTAANEELVRSGYPTGLANDTVWSPPAAYTQGRLSYGDVEMSGLSRLFITAASIFKRNIGYIEEKDFGF